MKGIIIYGNPMWGDNERATYCELMNETSFEISRGTGEIISCLEGETSKLSKTVCSKDDTYDFETGALIALMKMCGLEKSAKAYAEIFDDTAYGDALKERDRLDRLLREAKEVINTKARFIKEKNEEIEKLKKEKEQIIVAKSILNNKLMEENKKLKSDKDNSWKNYQRNIQKKQDRINALQVQVKTSEDDKQKNIEYYEKEIKELKGNIDELFESEQHTKSELGRLYFEKHRLEEQAEKLKLDCEKLQHGYNDMIFCGGRQNGKQYKALVELFKKIDQKKVDAAYKEAYNTELPVWQKEFFKQMYDITVYRKTELPRTLDINGTVYRKSIQIKDFGEQIKPLRPLTKREEMWGKILGDHKYSESLGVKVERAFINDFLSEAEDNGLVWANGGEKPTEWDKWEDWRRHDYIVFGVWYRGKTKELTWGYPSDEKTINYLPPMRWDLFKKGRIIIGVRREHFDEFKAEVSRQFGVDNLHEPYDHFNYSFYMHNKKTNFIEAVGRSQFRQPTVINGHKVVYWEDVRDKTSTMEDPYDTWKW